MGIFRFLRAHDWAAQSQERDLEIAAYTLAKRALLEGKADVGMKIVLRNCIDKHGAAWGDWEIMVRRVRLPAPVDTLPEGRDGEAGSVRSKGSAVGEAEAPTPSSHPHTPHTED